VTLEFYSADNRACVMAILDGNQLNILSQIPWSFSQFWTFLASHA